MENELSQSVNMNSTVVRERVTRGTGSQKTNSVQVLQKAVTFRGLGSMVTELGILTLQQEG